MDEDLLATLLHISDIHGVHDRKVAEGRFPVRPE
jgi:hypothetical protein